MAIDRCIDYATGWNSGTAAKVKAAGIDVVIRYFGPGGSWKHATKAECDSYKAVGVGIGVCAEGAANWMLGGYAAGVAAAATTVNAVVKAGGPSKPFIWAACDVDIVSRTDMAKVMACLDGVAFVVGKENTGIYGELWVCSEALDTGKAALAWQTYAWSNKQWLKDPRCVLWQHNEWGYTYYGKFLSDYDTNEVRGQYVGQWGASVTPPVEPPVEPPKPPVEVPMTTRGDLYLKYGNDAIDHNPDKGKDYIWGAEGQNADNKDGDAEWDCSGFRHAMLTRSGAGISDTRTTAEGYRSRAHRINKPTQVGDFGTFHRPATHIFMWTPGDKTIEAKGRDYGMVRSTVSNMNSRGAQWWRQDSINSKLKEVIPGATTPAYPKIPVLDAGSVYRLRHKNGTYFWTGSHAEAEVYQKSESTGGVVFEGEAWQTPKDANLGITRLRHKKTGEFHYSADSYEIGTLVGTGNWSDEGVQLYAIQFNIYVGLRPVERFLNRKTGKHFFSADADERKRVTADTVNWKSEGVVWYV